MAGSFEHGPRISGEEYDRKVVALHAHLPASPSAEQERRVRRAELDIMIDYRLGTAFPRPRRERLWEIQQRIERRRGRMWLAYLFRRLFRRCFLRSADRLAGFVVSEYARELTPDELNAYFGEDEVAHPALPVDDERL